MDCGHCGAANRDGARFCLSCGEELALRCVGCGAELPSTAKFCDTCGKPVAAQLIEEREAAATRKTVTVLFSDLTGSTSLGERLDPESIRAVMAPVYAAMRNEVESRGGSVAKFVGDGVMALFGIPDVHEDDAFRAVDAAVAMRAAIDQLSAGMPSPLSLKVGVNTGEVVTGAGDEDIVGDCVNVASRLEGAAAPGEILVGEETWRLTRSNATYDTVAPLALKGKAEPVPAYRLVSLERTQEAGTAPFVGRDSELRRLEEMFERVVSTNSSQLVSIIGSPGLGKTRLTRELGMALSEKALVVETRCDAAGSATFAPVADALRSAAGIDESASPEAIVDAISALVPDDEDRERVARRAAALLGAGEPGSTEETFWAIRRIVEAAGRALPMVLVIDDVHWAEPLMLDLIEHLANWIRNAPVLLVATGRPELRDIRPSLTERDSAVSLEGLDGSATEQLAQGLLGTDRVPRELVARLPESTEGNPLFVREFVRMLVDDGVLRQSDGEWVVTVNVDAIEIPPTIHSLLAARVDRLTPHERTVLELSSVVGKEFYRGAIHELAPAAVRVGLDGHLESLRRKELVEPAGTYWIDEPVFRFHHALIQDAAYRRLLKESRAELHKQVALWLEGKTAGVLGEHDELIGYHFEQAYESRRQLGPLDETARELGERASRLLASAARRALDLDDLPAAAGLSGRALNVLGETHADRPEILLVRCETLLATGDMSAARTAIGELERLAGSARLDAWAKCFAGELANMADPTRLHDTEKLVREAAVELADLGDAAGAAKAHTVRATALAQLGRVAECEVALDNALSAARQANDRRRVTDVLGRAPLAALWGPSPVSRAGGRCLDIVRLLRITTGSPAVEATSLRCQAVLEAFRGRTDAARRMLRKARRDLEELGLSNGIWETEMFAGIVELTAGDAPAAAEHLRAAHAGLLAMGVDVHAARAAALLARAHPVIGEEDEAEQLAEESERLGGDDLKTAIAWRAVRAEILARRGELDRARALAESAVEIASRTDALVDHGDACAALAEVCRAAGDADAARCAADEARSLYERKGATALVGERAETPKAERAAATQRLAEDPVGIVYRAIFQALAESDVERFNDLINEDCVWNDHRAGLRSTLVGRDAIRANFDYITAARGIEFDLRILAVRGDHTALMKVVLVDAPRTFEVQLLGLMEIDDARRLASVSTYDVEDIKLAVAELDARYIATLADDDPFRAAAEIVRAYNEGDWAGYRRILSDDFVLVDHRPASLGHLTRDQYVRAARELVTVIGGVRTYFAALHATAADRILTLQVNSGRSPDGAELDLSFYSIIQVRDGRVIRMEFFPLDRMGEAQSRFAELSAPAAASPIQETHCLRVVRRREEVFAARDWRGWAALLAEDVVSDDRRALGPTYRTGRDAIVSLTRNIADIGTVRIVHIPLAVRGERLALCKASFVGADVGSQPFENEVLQLFELDPSGSLAVTITVDASQFDEALSELEERFTSGEGAAFADVVNAATKYSRAYTNKDWETYESYIAEDIVHIDHRPVALGEIHGRDQHVKAGRTLRDVMPELNMYARSFPALAATACVVQYTGVGVTSAGAEADMSYCALLVVDDGKITRIERYASDEADRAVSRLGELVRSEEVERATTTSTLLENHCFRVFGRFCAAFERSDWDAVAACFADEATMEERRGTVDTRFEGRDAVVSGIRSANPVGAVKVRASLVATRGERLALVSQLFHGDFQDTGYFEVEALWLYQLDSVGTIATMIGFEPNNLDGALHELDGRFVRDEGAEAADLLRAVSGVSKAISRADESACRDLLTADVVQIDHRSASLGQMQGVDAVVESFFAFVNLVPGLRIYVQSVAAVRSDVAVASMLTTGRTADGTDFEVAFWGVGTVRDGRISRVERYEPDDLAAALARFDELAAGPVDWSRPPENHCIRTLRTFADLFAARDWAGVTRYLREDTVWTDNRPGLRDTRTGVAGVLEMLKATAAGGVVRIDVSPASAWADNIAGAEMFLRDEGSADLDAAVLSLTEVDDEGRIVAHAIFAEDDWDGVFFYGKDRLLASADPAVEAQRGATALMEAINAGDWGTMRQLLTDDFVLVDHRPASLGTLGPDEYVRAVSQLSEVVADLRGYPVALRRSAPDVQLGTTRIVGKTAERTNVDMTFHVLGVQRGDKLARVEWFALDRMDDATARFEELAAEEARPSTAARENTATRVASRWLAAFARRDWDAVADCCGPGEYRFTDHRSGLKTQIIGRDEVLQNVRNIAEVGATRIDTEVLATRGEHLALSRRRARTDVSESPWEAVYLSLEETDEFGRLIASDTFDEADLAAALSEVETRYARERATDQSAFAPSGDEHIGNHQPALENACTRSTQLFARLMERSDWSAIGELIAEDASVEDRRRGMQISVQGRSAWVGMLVATPQVGDAALTNVPLAIRGDRLALHRSVYSNKERTVEVETLELDELDDHGRHVRLTIFDQNDLDAAFQELDGRYTEINPGYAVFGALGRIAHEAHGTRNWDLLASIIAEDVTYIDHRPASLGETKGRRAMIDIIRGLTEVVPDVRQWIQSVEAIDADAGLILIRALFAGTNSSGGAIEVPSYSLVQSRDGQMVHQEEFPLEQRQAALARFEELCGSGRPSGLAPTTCTRGVAKFVDAYNRADWHAMGALWAEDAVREDRRSGLSTVIVGREAIVDNFRVSAELELGRIRNDIFATRGDRLALVRTLVTGRGAYEIEYVTLIETNDDGLYVRSIHFDPDELDAAFAELDDRYVAGEGAVGAACVMGCSRFVHELNARNWAGARACLTDDFALVDHRPASLGKQNADSWIESMRVLTDLEPEITVRFIAFHALARNTCIVGNVWRSEASAVEIVNVVLLTFEHETISGIEVFPSDQLATARKRFDELSRTSGHSDPSDNLCLRTERKIAAGFSARDWDAVSAAFAEEVFWEDRRMGFGTRLVGRDAVAKNLRAIAEVGSGSIDVVPIATRGETLALVSRVFHGIAEDDFETPILTVLQVDASGAMVARIGFEPEDLDAAFAELDDRYLAGEGRDYSKVLTVLFSGMRAWDTEDPDRFVSPYSEDFVMVDHRPASLGRIEGREAWAETLRALSGVLRDVRIRVLEIGRLADDCVLFRRRRMGVNQEGGSVEVESYQILVTSDALVTRTEEFPLDQHESALARFDELARDSAPTS